MRQAGRRILVLGAVALFAVSAAVGCINPFEPIEKTDRIEGLSYVDFSVTWDRWDSDPFYDGILVTPDYANEYGDALSFHDKPHQVVIEFYRLVVEEEPVAATREIGALIFARSVTYENSDDDIRVPIEAYRGALESAGYDLSAEVSVYVVLRVFPPEEFPRVELEVGGQADGDVVYRPEENITPNS